MFFVLLKYLSIFFGQNQSNLFVLGAASTARALSAYFDSLIDFAMKDYFIKHFPLHIGTLAEYADLFAMGSCLILTGEFRTAAFSVSLNNDSVVLVLLVVGIKESAMLNNIFTGINLTVTAVVVIVGLTKIQGHNWNISPDEVCL